MAKYNLNVAFKGVDSITGVIVDVAYKAKSGGTKFSNETNMFPSGNIASETFKVPGDKLTGKISFQNTGNGRFTVDGETYEFINPGSQSFKMKSKGGKKASKTIYVDLEKVPYAGVEPPVNFFLQAPGDFLSLAAVNDMLA